MEVTIGQFQQVQRLSEDHDQAAAEILAVGVLNNLSEKQVRDLPIDEYRKLKKAVNLDLTPLPQVPKDFTIDKVVYKIDLNFEVAGQFIDLSELKKNPIENMHMIMALFARPQGEAYMTNFAARAELFKEKCNYQLAQAVAFFFSRCMMELSRSIKNYSQVKGPGGMKRNGAGKRLWKIFQGETGQNGSILRT